ncbi:hypothetical protein ACIGO9_29720 [Nocardia asteroides]|uniref:hypothetical protein n=1 Tax=Nocardia asteroides TaxID=1824 RepID=UPI0037CB3F61
MITLEEAVAHQLREIIDGAAAVLAAVGDRAAADQIRAGSLGRAAKLAVQLCADNDEAAARVAALAPLLWPDPSPQWWATPLGRVAARHTSAGPDEALTFAAAAAMLGISTTAVHAYANSATADVDRHPDRGVTRLSVLRRIARLSRDHP